MKASEYIKHLELLIKTHGDLEVYSYFLNGIRVAPPPTFRQIAPLKPREKKLRYLNSWDKATTSVKDVIHI